MSEIKKPLCIELRDAKQEFVNAVNMIIAEHGLPAYLFRGIIEEVLTSVKELERRELEAAEVEYSNAINAQDKEGK